MAVCNLMVVMAIGVFAYSVQAQYDPDSNTVGLYHFDESSGSLISDSSGNGRDGIAAGTSIVNGRFGRARQYSVWTDEVRIPRPFDATSRFTIEAWVNVDSLRGNTCNCSNTILRNRQNTNDVYLTLTNDGRIHTNIQNDPITYGLFSRTRLDLHKWYHVAFTCDDSLMKIYVNGVLDTVAPSPPFHNWSVLYSATSIGSNTVDGSDWAFNGIIDEVRISSKARQANEFAAPTAPSLIFPANGASQVQTSPRMRWNSVFGVGSYRLQVSTDSSFLSADIDESEIADTSFPLSGLSVQTRYYWRVSSVGAGISWSSHRFFTVTGPRLIQFAGYQWLVKSGLVMAPGANAWSDDSANVWVDQAGHLHLNLSKIGRKWYCSELTSLHPSTYGIHRFYIIDSLDNIDRNVVFSPFLYANDEKEIDIEFSRWNSSSTVETCWTSGSPAGRGQYILQPCPYVQGNNLNRFSFTLNGSFSTHYFDWTSSQVIFKSIHGHYQEPPDSNYLIQQWIYSGSRNPTVSDSLRVHLQLRLWNGGRPPSDSNQVEVIVTSFERTTTEVEELKLALPAGNRLRQNYPNPFNPVTNFEFSLIKKCQVELSVYDLLGRVVRKLLADELKPGSFRITWDGHNSLGEQITSGLYFYRMSATMLDGSPTFVATRKLIFLK